MTRISLRSFIAKCFRENAVLGDVLGETCRHFPVCEPYVSAMLPKNVRLWAFSDPLGSVALARHAKQSVDSRALFSRPARRMKAQRRANNTNGMSKVRAGSRNEEVSCNAHLPTAFKYHTTKKGLVKTSHHHSRKWS